MTELKSTLTKLYDKANGLFSDVAYMRDDFDGETALKAYIVKYEDQLREEVKEAHRLMERIIDMAKCVEFPHVVHVGRNATYWRVDYDTYAATKSADEVPTLKSGYRSLDAIMQLKGDRL